MIDVPNCIYCKHFHGDSANPACDAFDAIPAGIWKNHVDHRNPYPGDRGVQYEPISDDSPFTPSSEYNIPAE
jgi:hypothetical protein